MSIRTRQCLRELWASRRLVWAGLLACCLAGAAAAATPAQVKLLWKVDTRSRLFTAATVADLNGDGLGEIIAAGMNSIIVYDGGGKRLWEWATPARFSTYPAVLARKGAPPLIYAADNAGNLTCLDGKGKVAWQARLHAPSNWAAAAVCDLEGDGRAEVVQTDEGGTVWAFDATTGKVRWEAAVEGEISASCSVGDLAGDERLEVVAGTAAGYLAAVDAGGKVLWSRKLGSGMNTAPVIYTASDGQGRVVAAADDGQVFCLDGQGNVLWQQPAGSPMDASISVGDINLDGRADIFLVTSEGAILRLDEDGKVIWTLEMQMRTDACGAIADLEGDGKLEYVLCTHKAELLALNEAGEVVWHYRLEGIPNAYNATPTFGEVNRASAGREMVVCGGDSGWLFCFGTPAPPSAPLQWGAYRRDLTMVGSWPGLARSQAVGASMIPVDVAWNSIYTGQGLRFRITNPQGASLRAEATCVTPSGVRHTATASMATPEGTLVLPVEVLAPGVHRVAWWLRDQAGKLLASGRRELVMAPFANDRALAQQASAALATAAAEVEAALPLSASALRREARRLEDEGRALASLQDAAPHAGGAAQREALGRTAALVSAARRGLQVAEAVRGAASLGAGTSIVASTGATWESLGADELLPSGATAPLVVRRRVVPEEHEPVAVNLFNVTDRELLVRVVVEAPEGIAVRPLRAFAVPTAAGLMSWDALPDLDETGTLAIPSLSNRQLWLDVAVGQVPAGEHEVKVRLLALNGAGVLDGPKHEQAVPAPETQVQVKLAVAPFAMAPEGAFRLCTWPYVESSQFKDIGDATYQDLLAHGNNVFIVSAWPEAAYDGEGRLGPVDYAKFDAATGRFRGKDVVLLLSGFPPLQTAEGKSEFGSPNYQKALKPYLDGLVAHLGAMGFDREHFALYPLDEAGGDGWGSIHLTVQFGKMVRAANPQVQIYADPGGPDPAMMEAIAPYIDIWSPGVNLVQSEPVKFNIMKATGKSLWSYNCSYNNYNKTLTAGWSLKAADIVSEYRIAAIWAFRQGLTGAGFWTSITGPEDPWTRTRTEYLMLYPGRSRPVTSRRWEGVREGIEDYRILASLKERLHERPSHALPSEVAARVKRLLEESVPRFVDGVTDEAGLAKLRAEMMDCVEAVAGK